VCGNDSGSGNAKFYRLLISKRVTVAFTPIPVIFLLKQLGAGNAIIAINFW
jgi:hypothetical protein